MASMTQSTIGIFLAMIVLACSIERSEAEHWTRWWKPAGFAGKRMFNGLADVGDFSKDYQEEEEKDLPKIQKSQQDVLREIDPAYIQAFLTAYLLSKDFDVSRDIYNADDFAPLLSRIMNRQNKRR